TGVQTCALPILDLVGGIGTGPQFRGERGRSGLRVLVRAVRYRHGGCSTRGRPPGPDRDAGQPDTYVHRLAGPVRCVGAAHGTGVGGVDLRAHRRTPGRGPRPGDAHERRTDDGRRHLRLPRGRAGRSPAPCRGGPRVGHHRLRPVLGRYAPTHGHHRRPGDLGAAVGSRAVFVGDRRAVEPHFGQRVRRGHGIHRAHHALGGTHRRGGRGRTGLHRCTTTPTGMGGRPARGRLTPCTAGHRGPGDGGVGTGRA